MPYQIRQFHVLFHPQAEQQKEKDMFFQNQDSFPDIYVFKQGSVHIGVKFRNPVVKKYGFKIQSVQIKIDKQVLDQKGGCAFVQGKSIHSHLNFFQKWKKYQVDFKFKLLKPSVFHDSIELQKLKNKEIEKAQWKNQNPLYSEEIGTKYHSYKCQLQHLNIVLTQTIKNYFSKKSSLQNEMHQDNFITSWLDKQNPIQELFIINKKKYKTSSWQAGKNLAESFSGKTFKLLDSKQKIHQLKHLVMQTFSQEGKKGVIEPKINPLALKNETKSNQQTVSFEQMYDVQNEDQNLVQRHKKEEKYKWNISYPQLIEDLYRICTTQH